MFTWHVQLAVIGNRLQTEAAAEELGVLEAAGFGRFGRALLGAGRHASLFDARGHARVVVCKMKSNARSVLETFFRSI